VTVALSDNFRAAASVGRRNFLDTGSANATAEIYATDRPAGGGEPGGVPLLTVVLAKPCGVITAGSLILAANDPAGELIAHSGIAVWARFVNGAGEWAFDCDVSISGGVGEVQFPVLQLYAGGRAPLSPSAIG
jgi:hypothetical protein